MAEFIAENEVKQTIAGANMMTPGGQEILEVEYKNSADKDYMTKLKYDVIKTANRSDATKARNTLVQHLGASIYAVMVEYGLALSEIDPVLDEVVRLVNHGQEEANEVLWGGNKLKRTLLDVNKVLVSKYGTKPETKA